MKKADHFKGTKASNAKEDAEAAASPKFLKSIREARAQVRQRETKTHAQVFGEKGK